IEKVRTLVYEIPVNTSGEGISRTISLDGEDVDNDIYIFLQHSFTELQSRHPDFPQPTVDELVRLANRAGRRFIVASTMMKFVDDGYNDPRDRLELMLELTNELLPGTEVYELYNRILATCSDPSRAYQHLSIVAALADPLPISQISKLLGPGQGRDVATALIQLRSFMDIPADSSHPVNIYHSSIRDYVSDFSNCSLLGLQPITAPHSLLASSSFRLMIQDIPERTTLMDALSELKSQNQAMQRHDPRNLQQSLAFIVEPPEPLQVLMGLLWLQGAPGSGLQSWLRTLDGRAWLQTRSVGEWLKTPSGGEWLATPSGGEWLATPSGRRWLETPSGRQWLKIQSGREWLVTPSGRGWLETPSGRRWLNTSSDEELKTPSEGEWLILIGGRLLLIGGFPPLIGGCLPLIGGCLKILIQISREWLKTLIGWCLKILISSEWPEKWMGTPSRQEWLETPSRQEWLETPSGTQWLETSSGRQWLKTQSGRKWLETSSGRQWLETPRGGEWLKTLSEGEWLETPSGGDWLETPNGRQWLKTWRGWEWLKTSSRREWLKTSSGREWLKTPSRRQWLKTGNGRQWLETKIGRQWLETPSGRQWLKTQYGRGWLETQSVHDRLQILNELQTPIGLAWLDTSHGREWLLTQSGHEWLLTNYAQEWLLAPGGREWLHTPGGQKWLRTPGGLQTEHGQEWLQTKSGKKWLLTLDGRMWLQTMGGREWLQTERGREWLQTPHGQEWQLTPAASVWVTMEDFSNTLETISGHAIIPQLHLPPAVQAIQEFKNLPDFLMFPAFLALKPQYHSTSVSLQDCPDIEVLHTMTTFTIFATKARERSQSSSDALKYACQNWVFHLSRALSPIDHKLNLAFKLFWDRHLLSWLERQWCLKGLCSCLLVLSEGQKLAQVCSQ
ncbi:uncharacterized protein HD556DRAFT_1316055, partial [Suillus plorans]